jgi:hypothetical protein
MAVACVFGGFVAIGLNTAMLNGVLEATPDENRLPYIAFYNTALNISLFLAPLFSLFLLTHININGVFFIIAGMRLMGAIVLIFSKGRKT